MAPIRACLLALAGCLALAAPAAGQEPLYTETVKTTNLEIVASDGVVLRGDLLQPAVSGRAVDSLPTVIIKMGYNKDDPSRSERDSVLSFARAGFAALIVDSRGTGASEGTYCFLCRREALDGYDVVEWAARQKFSDGRIGMWGYSEPGINAELSASTGPPHLRAIVPAAAFSDGYRDVVYPGGIPASVDLVVLGALFAGVVPNKRINPETDPALAPTLINSRTGQPTANPAMEAILHPEFDDYWKERAFWPVAAGVRVPALHVSGWQDIYPRAASLNYLTAPERNALILGPWGHLGATGGPSGDLIMAASLAWFDIYLRTPSAALRAAKLARFPRVAVFDVDPSSPTVYDGRESWRGTWRSFAGWLPEHTTTSWNLCPGPADPPTGSWATEASLVRSDPCPGPGSTLVAGAPVELTGGTSIIHDGGSLGGFDDSNFQDPADQKLNVSATAFVGPVLEEAMTITGPSAVRLTATTAATDTDWVARVVDIAPDGGASLVAKGWLRASHRAEDPSRPGLWHTHTNPMPLVPNAPYEVGIEIWPMSHRFVAGHRLAILVNSADSQKVASTAAASSQVVIADGTPATFQAPVRTDRGTALDPKAAYLAALAVTEPLAVSGRRTCRSRRRLTIHARLPRGQRVRRAGVRVAGKRVKRRIAGRSVVARIDMRGFRRRTVRVTVRIVSTSGRKFTARRVFHTCVPRRRV